MSLAKKWCLCTQIQREQNSGIQGLEVLKELTASSHKHCKMGLEMTLSDRGSVNISWNKRTEGKNQIQYAIFKVTATKLEVRMKNK